MNTKITLGDDRDYLVWRDGGGGTIEIFDIVVGTMRGAGRGRRLLEKLFSTLPEKTRVWAITRADNEIAQQFYEHTGFEVIGVLRRFYGHENGVDAIMYGRYAGGAV